MTEFLKAIYNFRFTAWELRQLLQAEILELIEKSPEVTQRNSLDKTKAKLDFAIKRSYDKTLVVKYVLPILGYSEAIDVIGYAKYLGFTHFKRGVSKLFDRDHQMVYVLLNALNMICHLHHPLLEDALTDLKQSNLKFIRLHESTIRTILTHFLNVKSHVHISN